MRKIGGDPYLTQETIRPECCGKIRTQDFNGHFALMFYIVGEIDRGKRSRRQRL